MLNDGYFGFSWLSALGAFIMGSIIAETTQAERIEHLIKPRFIWAVFFCVCRNVLIDPTTL
jgi:CPA2 family monovalent cation:H+ antiporter-2